MTFEELENTLPNGFHDCFIHALNIDYSRGTATLDIEVDCDEINRRLRVELTGLVLFAIDAPEFGENLGGLGALEACGESPGESTFPFAKYLHSAPAGAFAYSFWLRQLNSYIRVAAAGLRVDGV